MFRRAAVGLALILLLGACGESSTPSGTPSGAGAGGEQSSTSNGSNGDHGDSPSETGGSVADKRDKIDPKRNGFEITLGEWAVTPEASALRPGPVTFVITNRGTMEHGFEIELEGESSGSGSGELFKAESRLLKPGETTRMTVELAEGMHKIECLVDGHDDMGMEGPLDVSKKAPLVREEEGEKAAGNDVAITDFAFSPDSLTVGAGTEITWSNDDPTPHTVTGSDDGFDSGVLEAGDGYSFTFAKVGTFEYSCNIHPDMVGTVEVE